MSPDLRQDNYPEALHVMTPEAVHETLKLIRKLRWIGMDEDAERLQRAIITIPASGRASVLSWPASTD